MGRTAPGSIGISLPQLLCRFDTAGTDFIVLYQALAFVGEVVRVRMDRRERVARIVIIVAGLTITVAGFLPWPYGPTQWRRGIESDGVVVLVVGAVVTTGLAIFRIYLPAVLFWLAALFPTMFSMAVMSGGFFGEEPEELALVVGVTFYAEVTVLIAGIVASVLKRRANRLETATTPQAHP